MQLSCKHQQHFFTKFFSCIFEDKAKDTIANASKLRRGEM